jgi:hypothetical protein
MRRVKKMERSFKRHLRGIGNLSLKSRIQNSGVRIQNDRAETASTDFLFFWLLASEF